MQGHLTCGSRNAELPKTSDTHSEQSPFYIQWEIGNQDKYDVDAIARKRQAMIPLIQPIMHACTDKMASS